jgi:hypothetical protein
VGHLLLAIIRLFWKDLSAANTLAYLAQNAKDKETKFYNLDARGQSHKTLKAQIYSFFES